MTDLNKAPYAALVLRVTLGVLALAHGLLKIVVFTPAGTACFFESLGLPGALAYVVIAVELAAGLALITGIFTRYAAIAIIPILLGAIAFAHGHNGWLFTNQGGGWEYPAFWTVALAVQAMLGDGAFVWKPRAARQRVAVTMSS
ncbi:MAG: DoxX family protein, partial [Arenicellales bacterium]